jgi:NAD(P)H dehydrogenase (quinone)
MILLTGATGQLGTTAVTNLLKKISANQIAALVRDKSKISALKEQGIESYGDPTSLYPSLITLSRRKF